MPRHTARRLPCALAITSLLVAALAHTAGLATAEPAAEDALRLNQLQYVGTHNSYHLQDLSRERPLRESNYSHATLDVQLDRGVRSFELDMHYREGEFVVFHVPKVDEKTTCPTLAEGLATVRTWSDAHPRHVPISFLFELKKEGPVFDKRIKEIDAAGFDRLDAVLREAFPGERIITPDAVRGDAETLREAVTSRGWPSLAEARGKVLFVLHDDDKKRALYTEGHPSLRGRAMFVRSDPSRDDAATLVMDNPRDPEIPKMVAAGYFVRTRADSGLNGNVSRRDAALASGAHIISTDFPTGEAQAATGYVVEFAEGAPARVNPVNGPQGKRGDAFKE